MLAKKRKIKEQPIFCIALIIGLLLSSAIYAGPKEGRGGDKAQGRSMEKSASVETRADSAPSSAPVTSSRPQSIQQRQSAMPRSTDRIETQPSPASGPPVQSEPPRSIASQNRSSRIVSGNPTVSVSGSKDTPEITVSPPAFQDRNGSALSPGTSKGGVNRSVNQPQTVTTRSDSRQLVPVAVEEKLPVTISAEKASRIGRNISAQTNVDTGKTDTAHGRNERVEKTTLPQSKTDKIGSVIGQTTIDEAIANRWKNKTERLVARETDNRSVTVEKTAGLEREALTRRDNVNRETSQRTVMPTPHTDSEKAGSPLERERPGNRTERVIKSNVRERTAIIDKDIVEKHVEYHGDRASRTIIYHDRPGEVRHTNHYEHIYRDRHNNFCRIAVWPQYYFWVSYGCGPSWNFTYVHPFYHRKYIFVSLGGWWPEYSCVRYYWYNYHPFEWYGFYPVPQEVYGGNTYNYYTYNYYNTTTDGGSAATSYAAPAEIPPVDHTTFADVRAKMQQQAESTPDVATKADEYFDEAVKAFEINCFNLAADKFAEAMKLAPDDMILPFAYSQSLLAIEKYTESADILRTALVKVTPDKEGVFYPRGLYADEDTLTNQVKLLGEKAKLYPYDADLQLLLGYQLLGLGELDEAESHLTMASQDTRNAPAANVLLDILAKMRARIQDSNDIQPNPQ
jgi:tetratricopeptide (TPR) repeat protein